MTVSGRTSADQTVENTATAGAARPNDRGFFPKIMRAARSWWPSKVAEELAAIMGCDVRSAERYLAGDRTPNAEAVLALITSAHGVKLIGLIAADMPPREQAAFWREMARAARRSELIDEKARIERELKSVGG